jgi:hypothetical protein
VYNDPLHSFAATSPVLTSSTFKMLPFGQESSAPVAFTPSLWFNPKNYLYGLYIFPFIFPLPYQERHVKDLKPQDSIRHQHRNKSPEEQKLLDIENFQDFIRFSLAQVFSHLFEKKHTSSDRKPNQIPQNQIPPVSLISEAYPSYSYLFLDSISTPLYSFFICLNEHIFSPEENHEFKHEDEFNYTPEGCQKTQFNIQSTTFAIDSEIINYQITKSEMKNIIRQECDDFLKQHFSFKQFKPNNTDIYNSPSDPHKIFQDESLNLPTPNRSILQYPPYPPSLLPLIDFSEDVGEQVYDVLKHRWNFDFVSFWEWPNAWKRAQNDAILSQMAMLSQTYGYNVGVDADSQSGDE